MIISVHIPRTAGSSFRRFLDDHFGPDLYQDYGNPILVNPCFRKTYASGAGVYNSLRNSRKNYKCIHGHFLPYKYSYFNKSPENKFAVWVRDPIERLVSHYNYIYQIEGMEQDYSPFQRRVIREKWDLQKFCFSNEMRNSMSNFFWKFPLENFDFIGEVEHYKEDLEFFAERFCKKAFPSNIKVNATDNKHTPLNPLIIEKIKELHYQDYELYHRAHKIRSELRAKGY